MSSEIAMRFGSWLGEMNSRKGTELLLAQGEPVMVRVDGSLERLDDDPLKRSELDALAVEALGEHQVRALGATQAVVYATVELSGVSWAVSAARSSGKLCIRALPLKPFTMNPTNIRIPPALLQAIDAPGGGLVMTTGPIGSGKTTTAYILIEHLNIHRPLHIVLAEYYSEWIFEAKRACVQRRQVGLDAPDMVSAIHSAIVQDADVIFVGEIRDPETAMACLHAAENGRLVLTQLHEPTPEAAIERFATLDIGGASTRRLLARHLRAVAAQRLLPRASGGGRVPAYGVLVPDEQMRRDIIEGTDVLRAGCPLPPGCSALSEDIERLLRENLVTPEAAALALS